MICSISTIQLSLFTKDYMYFYLVINIRTLPETDSAFYNGYINFRRLDLQVEVWILVFKLFSLLISEISIKTVRI